MALPCVNMSRKTIFFCLVVGAFVLVRQLSFSRSNNLRYLICDFPLVFFVQSLLVYNEE